MSQINPEKLGELLRYNPDTGMLFWLPRRPEMFADGPRAKEHRCSNWNSKMAGLEAFTAPHSQGYRIGRINGRAYFAHRVIWAMQTGAWPSQSVDHIDGDRSNNRWDNLRAASIAENCRNQRLSLVNTSGVKGVVWDKRRKKWVAQIGSHGKHHYLGQFHDINDAATAYAAASVQLHGAFGRIA